MTRVQVLLTEEQDRRLETLARKRRVSKGSLVREGVELLFKQGAGEDTEPLLKLIGQAGRSTIRDGSIKHDKYLAAAERRRNR
jgi:Arc/MetJ-type ribon-helix-helix transcriptional regulator